MALHRAERTVLHLVRRNVVNYAPHALSSDGFFLRVPLFPLFQQLTNSCEALLDPLGWHPLGCAREAMDDRHCMLRDPHRPRGWPSTATEQFAAELPLASQNTARPPHRRGDVRVMAAATEPASKNDVVVTSTPH